VEFFLRSEGYWRAISEFTAGIAVPNVNASKLASLVLPLAPFAEQSRIVARLEKLLGKVGTCQRRVAKIPVHLKHFRQAVLAAACSGRLTADWREENETTEDAAALLNRMQAERRERSSAANGKRKYRMPEPVLEEDLPAVPATWCWTNFDHCSWEITVGHVGPMKDRYVERGVAFLRCQNVRPLRFDAAGLVSIPSEFHAQLSKSKLKGGEILVVRSGANTGDCCVFPHDFGEANCADLVITRPLSGLCAEYGALYVCSPTGQARLVRNETGIAQHHFNIAAMRVKAFPLPPFAEQQEIVRRVEALLALAGRIEARAAKAQVHVDRLSPSLLAKAFHGELVPTEAELARREGYTYEPASDLLNRLRVEHARANSCSHARGSRRSRPS
jgi:type I restriction enzyme S subunit